MLKPRRRRRDRRRASRRSTPDRCVARADARFVLPAGTHGSEHRRQRGAAQPDQRSSTVSATTRSRRQAASSRAAPARPAARPSCTGTSAAAPIVDNYVVAAPLYVLVRRRWRRQPDAAHRSSVPDRHDPRRPALQRGPPHHLRAGDRRRTRASCITSIEALTEAIEHGPRRRAEAGRARGATCRSCRRARSSSSATRLAPMAATEGLRTRLRRRAVPARRHARHPAAAQQLDPDGPGVAPALGRRDRHAAGAADRARRAAGVPVRHPGGAADDGVQLHADRHRARCAARDRRRSDDDHQRHAACSSVRRRARSAATTPTTVDSYVVDDDRLEQTNPIRGWCAMKRLLVPRSRSPVRARLRARRRTAARRGRRRRRPGSSPAVRHGSARASTAIRRSTSRSRTQIRPLTSRSPGGCLSCHGTNQTSGFNHRLATIASPRRHQLRHAHHRAWRSVREHDRRRSSVSLRRLARACPTTDRRTSRPRS